MSLAIDLCFQEDNTLLTDPLQHSSEKEDGPEGMEHVQGPESAPASFAS